MDGLPHLTAEVAARRALPSVVMLDVGVFAVAGLGGPEPLVRPAVTSGRSTPSSQRPRRGGQLTGHSRGAARPTR